MLDQPGKRNYYKSRSFQRMGETKKKNQPLTDIKRFEFREFQSLFVE